MPHELNVWLYSELVGKLSLVNGRLQFEYASQWLQKPNVVAVELQPNLTQDLHRILTHPI